MSLYDILGVDRDASFDVIRKAYLDAVRVAHPDKNLKPVNCQRHHSCCRYRIT